LVGDWRSAIESDSGEITRLLGRIQEGDESARPRLIDLVYRELRHLADSCMRHERRDHTLQPTALVHEAYIRRLRERNVNFQNRIHFLAAASTVMRCILVDYARANLAQKRGGWRARIELDENLVMTEGNSEQMLALNRALERLTALDPRQGKIVDLRFFGGLTEDETAVVLSLSPRTVNREWQSAKAWL
jgi:RNA polymerase sigma-70 factor (ECF subfamily)